MALTDLQRGVITLIRSAITGESYSLPSGFTIEKALPIIFAHGISTLAYHGAKNCGIEKNKMLFQNVCGCIASQEKQDAILTELKTAFDEAEFDYIPLKGSHLRKYYPYPYMRRMGDIDILIRMEQYAQIRLVMEKLGYLESNETDHELHWKKSGVLIELHKRLIPSHNLDFYEYYSDGWDLAQKIETKHWQMTPEDEFVYVFTHFVKHYRDGGIGLMHLTDLWILRDTYDKSKVETKLKQLRLFVFYQNIMKVLDACFNDGVFDEKSEFITERILNGGTYGTLEMQKKAQLVRNVHANKSVLKTRIVESVHIIFPSYAGMCQLYPVLVKRRYLLPLMWLNRWINRLCHKREKVKAAFDSIQRIDSLHANEYQSELEYVGLDFWF